MRDWDKEEKEPFSGFAVKDEKYHEHSFDSTPGVTERKCVICGKTREQLRSEWT